MSARTGPLCDCIGCKRLWEEFDRQPIERTAAMTYTAKDMARRFHDTYERLAPSFGYETRADTRQFDEDSPNGKLMIAVCADLLEAQEGAGKIEDVHGNTVCVNGEWMDFRDARLVLVPNPDDAWDAARYRWLRDRCDTTTGFLLCQRVESNEWDAQIDAAMAEGGDR